MAQRDLVGIELPMWGRVVAGDDYVPWLVVDHGYAYDLLRWWRCLYVVEVAWSRASMDEV
ncbi:hypothetical protein [Kribbella sp. NPDC023855]|uniref:hypothetical protein n=1 Tax=Kribbella sp. NPDC023855 TaxID=3154698 RepID=UPI0033C5DBCC